MRNKHEEGDKNTNEVNEPAASYSSREIHLFHSFEEQEALELKKMAALSPLEILQHLRPSINIAYGMHGYNPDNLPVEHRITIIAE